MSSPPPFDPPMTDEQVQLAGNLSDSDLLKIDRQLLKNSAVQYRKSARVIGATMMDIQKEYPGVPDVFYSTRLINLVEQNRLEAQGDLRRMRYSEVRLAK
ncbi:hypothetical protein R50072_35410 [Simiduia litorea]